MIRTLKSGIAALAVAACVVGVAQAPADAVSATVIVKLGARAHLSATGKTASVKVTVTCKNALPAPIHVEVTQNRGSITVHGSGDSAGRYKCNGRSQSGVVKVTADPGSRFNNGGASATATVTVGDNGSGTASDSDNRNIQLTK